MRETDERKLQILGAIVEDYVATREPVGSKSLLERHELGVSAATVRNDMSALEEEGTCSPGPCASWPSAPSRSPWSSTRPGARRASATWSS